MRVFMSHRYARQKWEVRATCPQLVDFIRRGERTVSIHRDHRVDKGIDLVNAAQVSLDEFARTQLSSRERTGKFCKCHPMDVRFCTD
ncbi:hypothetical protein BAU01nite_29790 [Brevibacterium aurantiacum]|nr:hypothetical protein BAU01nite_29790 [Brevibacterium aurantiacum]